MILEGQAVGACSFDELGVVLDDSGHVSGGWELGPTQALCAMESSL